LININRTMLKAAKVPVVELSYGRGETVYERGTLPQFVYAVEKGTLYRFRSAPRKRRAILQFLFPGDGFGYEIRRRHLDTVQALTNAKVLAASRDALLAAAASDPRLSSLLFSCAATAATAAEEKAVMLGAKTATERVARFLLEMEARLSTGGVIDLPMRRHQIAEHLGLTTATISRVISAFGRKKIIQVRGLQQRQIVIQDKQRLQGLTSDAFDLDSASILKPRKNVKGRRVTGFARD